MKKTILLFAVCAVVLLSCARNACCEGHYQGGIMNLRDFMAPPKDGFILLIYDPLYMTDDMRDNDGDKIGPISGSRMLKLGPGQDIAIDVTGSLSIEPELKSYTFQPLLAYFKKWEALGGPRYGLIVAPAYSYVDVKIKANYTGDITINGNHYSGVNKNIEIKDSASGFADMMVRPVMLDWAGERYDIFAAYSFCAPTGSYNKNDLANVGLGYWSHEVSLGGALYFNKKATALVGNANYEINTEKDGMDVTPGQNIVLEYGVHQYFTPQFGAGVSGASYFQVTDDSGSDVMEPDYKQEYHSVGAEMEYWFIPHKFSIVGRYFYQYYARNIGKGQGANVTARIIF